MIERWAGRMALSIKNANPERTASVEVMKFSLIILLNAFCIIVLSMIIGIAFGFGTETLIVLIGFAVLRFFSGGLHLNSSDWCVAVSTAVIVVTAVAPVPFPLIWLHLATLLLVVLFAPSRIEGQLKVAVNQKTLLKAISILIVASNLYWNLEPLAKAFFIQSLLLLPFERR